MQFLSRRAGHPLDHLNLDFGLIAQHNLRSVIYMMPLRLSQHRIRAFVRNADCQTQILTRRRQLKLATSERRVVTIYTAV